MLKISELNPFSDFNFNRDPGLFACIGNNSGINSEERDSIIADGYRTNAKLLFEAIKSGKEFQDTCVYPLFFSCRHSIELSLKLIISKLLKIYIMRNNLENDDDFCREIRKILISHSIKELVDSFKQFQSFDADIKETFDELDDFELYIRDYFFDVEADAFRYTYKNDKLTVNLCDKRLLHIGILYTKYETLIKQLDYYYSYFCSLLYGQYATGTYTKKLSREQLKKISIMIDINNLDTFDEIKEKIITEYNLSRNDFSKALDVIKKHREFSSNIGREIKFGDIKEKTIKELVYLINLVNKIREIEPLKKDSILELDQYTEENKILKEKLENELEEKANNLFNKLKRSEINELLSFYEINLPSNYYSEDLDMILKYWQEIGQLNNNYIISKLCFSTDFKSAFKKCGQETYLEWFEKYLQLSDI
ncbi:MAG: hypothetical protein PHN42_00290 [Bacilli bacterium]|nr:hypothetical protein [Bacilli bacterium]